VLAWYVQSELKVKFLSITSPNYPLMCPLHSTVPHFEKMLYDQGQIVNVYLDTFLITGDEYYSTVARDILDYLRREMIGKEGEIFSAEDADSAEYEGAPRKKEGAFYVWTSKEVHPRGLVMWYF
jgi:uncharacterized protein YyaL (SSP411 family)